MFFSPSLSQEKNVSGHTTSNKPFAGQGKLRWIGRFFGFIGSIGSIGLSFLLSLWFYSAFTLSLLCFCFFPAFTLLSLCFYSAFSLLLLCFYSAFTLVLMVPLGLLGYICSYLALTLIIICSYSALSLLSALFQLLFCSYFDFILLLFCSYFALTLPWFHFVLIGLKLGKIKNNTQHVVGMVSTLHSLVLDVLLVLLALLVLMV